MTGSPAPTTGRTYTPGLFAGRTVVVTGGTSGIGAAVAEAFAGLGAEVLAAGLSDSIPDQRPGPAGTDTALPVPVELDVTDGAAVDAFFGVLDRLDVLVNCAGIIARDREFDPEVFARVLDVNLTGTMRTCHAAVGLLEASSGCVINTASMHSFVSGPRVPAYTASKGGIAQLTKALAAAWAERGVRVNAIAPGWISTPLTAAIEDTGAGADIADRTPMRRWGRPGEVAQAAVFLATPAAGFVTGAVLAVDGGFLTS